MKQSLVVLTCVLLYACCSTLAAPTQKCKKVVDIVMVLDESGSIGRNNWRKVKKFVRRVISRFSVTPFGAHFAAVKYNNRPRKVFSLTKYTNARKLRKAVRRMRYRGGGTRTGKALRFTNRKILWGKDDRKDVPNVVVLVSDGKSNDHRKAVREARKMKQKGVRILCVGIGRGRKVDRLIKQLQEISSKPEYTFKTTMNALDTIENSLVKDMCEPISACASKPCQNGGSCVDDGNGGYQCKCSANWEGKNCELPKSQKCRKVVDIVMVLDESGSIGRKNWRKVKKFVRHVISRFSVAPFGAHFAAVKYNNRPRKVFSLTKYTNTKKLRKAVRRMRYRGGGTRTGKALRFTNRKILWGKDDRKDVPNVVVLVSDGKSHDHRKAVREARKMKQKGVKILCVGIGRGRKVDRLIKKLQEISSKPEYTFKTTINALDTIENSLVKNMCEPISACASKPCQNGGQCVDDGNGGYQCKCSPNWEGKNCEVPKCSTLCPVEPFAKKGCYRTPKPHTATLLFNRRNQIDWEDRWDNFIEKIVHDCGKAAKDGGYKYFCIEFYGECWGYKDFNVNQTHAGANACWGKRPNFKTCDDSQKNPICVGTANHGYIYELN